MASLNSWKIIILSVLTLGILGGAGYVYFLNSATDRFKGYDVTPFDCVSPDYMCNVRLIGIKNNGVQVVVEENLTEQFRAKTGRSNGVVIDKFYFPENSDELIFVGIVGSSGCCELYKYNVLTKVFSENGSVYTMDGGEEPSPDKSMLVRFNSGTRESYDSAFPYKDARLVVVDTLSNSVIATVTPKEGETFIKGFSGYGAGPYGEYSWIDGSTFTYNVYDAEVVPKDTESYSTFLETRTYTVQR
ncbi:hypothetical protein K2X83_01435 [Patescibacteria group bacterium]|nr:hypothetical protein [Patescibacteria group bacterium]